MIDVAGLKLSLDAGLPENETKARAEIAKQLGVKPGDIKSAQLIKRSVDARKKSHIHFIATYRLAMEEQLEEKLLKQAEAKSSKLKGLQIHIAKPYQALEIPHLQAAEVPPVVVGAGPAGLFAAWYLAKAGANPVLIEQGAPVEERQGDVQTFFETGKLNPWSNIQFGEGGAGTFSDGKLTTNTKNKFTQHVLHWFVDAGAPESILWQAHPHLGSDNLAQIVRSIREDIIALGGTVLFHTQLVDMEFDHGALQRITVENTQSGAQQHLRCNTLILACGHSARAVFELVRDAGFAMEQKPFSIGARIEHPQQLINEAQWGSASAHPALGAAEYKLAVHLPEGRSVYSFCMCPGGEVVAAASEEGGIVTNGMSNYARDGKNANAAILVNVDPDDFGSDDVLAGITLQRSIEQRAFEVSQASGGAPYQAPAQRVGSFLGAHTMSESAHSGALAETDADCSPTYGRGVVEVSLDQVFPNFITDALRQALPIMGKKIKGFDDPRAILTAPETRSSSPVRICRDVSLQAYFASDDDDSYTASDNRGALSEGQAATGLYPCGEGPGFAGGIMSAAVDGLKVATAVAHDLQLRQAVQALKTGEPVIFPTDTVYGLGVAVDYAASPAALYELKGRSDKKPIAWLVDSPAALETYGANVSEGAKELARHYWPGALTLIVEASEAVPEAYRCEEGTIALRMPDSETALQLIRAAGPLATTSANLSGSAAPSTLDEVPQELLAKCASIEGKTFHGSASTIVDCTGVEPAIVRKGSVDITDEFHANESGSASHQLN